MTVLNAECNSWLDPGGGNCMAIISIMILLNHPPLSYCIHAEGSAQGSLKIHKDNISLASGEFFAQVWGSGPGVKD